MRPGAIVLFDGVCNFCNGSVNFVLRRDPKGVFRFAALQSDSGRRVLEQAGIADHGLDGLVLVEGNEVSVKSTAALRISRRLGNLWPLTAVFLLVPRVIRDWAYDWFAARRYRWFGQRDECMIPTPEMRTRFIEEPEEVSAH